MIKRAINSAIAFVFYSFLVMGQALAADASLLPNGLQQFFDNNGNPLTAGKVYFYIPNTTTPKTTWQDAGKVTANSNPVILDAAGRAKIYGEGIYRQILRKSNNDLVWDVVTTSYTPQGSAVISTGDGDLVGTIKPWAGLVAPNQYAFAYGQEVSRTTYSVLFTAITLQPTITCASGSPTASGFSDTTQIPIGAIIESTCFAPATTVISKTSTTVTFSNNSAISTSEVATIFLYGNGNGSTTFNLPDLRGQTVVGRNNMGGTASANLTSTYYGTNPNATGAGGGSQSKTMLTANLPAYTPTGTINTPTITNTFSASGTNSYTPTGSVSTPTITVNNGGNIVNANAGTLNLGGGAAGNTTTITATSSTPIFTGNAVSLTSASSTLTFTGAAQGGTATAFGLVQPSKTLNYIIKITPDSNSAEASGVTSIEGMTGDIACGSGLLCTGNIINISSTPPIALPTSHILVGNGSNLATDFGTLATFSSNGTLSILPTTGTTAQGIYTEQISTGTPASTNLFGWGINHHYCLRSNLDVSAITAPISNCLLVDVYPGDGSKGNVVGTTSAVTVGAGVAVDTTTSWDYVGHIGFASTKRNLGGSGTTTATAKGGVFGAHHFANSGAGATNLLGLAGMEIDVFAEATSSMSRRGGITIVDFGSAVQGAEYDCALCPSKSAGAIGWLNGILFSDYNGDHPVHSTGKLIATQGAASVAYGIDLNSYTFTTAALRIPGMIVNSSARTGLGTETAPTCSLHVSLNSTTGLSCGIAGTILGITAANASGASALYGATAYGGATSPTVGAVFSSSRGTAASPTQTQIGDILTFFGGRGMTNTPAFSATQAAILALAADAFTASAQGTDWYFQTTPSGSTTRGTAAVIHNSTGLSVGNAVNPGAGAISATTTITAGTALVSTTYTQVGTKIRAAGSAPALSSCGTSPAISGSDLAGTVTMGTGAPTGCVITFNAAYAAAPYCVVTWRATPLASQSYTISTSAITLTQTGTSSNVVDYHCIARSGG